MIGATITGGVSSVTKGDAGESAYEIAVRNGYTCTEQEWLASLSANATTATAAATSAQSSATAAAASANAAASSAESARSYMTAAAESAADAQDGRTAAEASAATASTAASSATADAAYIAGQIQGVLLAADRAATSELNAQNSAGQAATSEANARISEQQAALHAVAAAGSVQEAQVAAQTAANEAHDAVSAAVLNAQNSANAAAASASQAAASAQTASEQASASASAAVNAAVTSAQTSATQAAASATAAANSANSAAQTIADFNANTELAHTYATSAGGYANNAQASAASAADSANRAEAALGHALAPLDNYYTKSQTDNAIATLSTGISRLNGLVVTATDETAGMMKLYDEPGEDTDGTMTQGAIKTGIDNVQNALLAHVSWAEGKLTQVYKFKGSVAYYANLPQSGMENGDVYNIRNSNKAAGINAGDNVAWVAPTVEGEEGEWDKLAGVFVLLPADATTLGGVKIGSNISVAADGTISISSASSQTAGVLKLYTTTGTNTDGTMTQGAIKAALDLKMDASASPSLATTQAAGIVKIGTNVSVASDGTISVTDGSTSAKGVLKVGSNLTASGGTVSLTKSNVTGALGYTPTKSVAFTQSLTSGTAVGTLTINETSYTLYCQTNTNTDTKVTQTVTTTNANYPILCKNTNAEATITDAARFASGVTINPSTKTITATTFNGTATSIPTVSGLGNIWIE